MDNNTPPSRMSFWTVWGYITGAVSRYLRPDPTKIDSRDPKSSQRSTVGSEPTNCGHTEGHSSRREVDEEQPLATVPLLGSSRPVVAWELSAANTDLGPDEESVQHKTQPSKASESKASEEGRGTREEPFAQIGNDAELVIAKDTKEDEQEENEVQKLYTHGPDEVQENDEDTEHVNTRSLRLTEDVMSEDAEKSERKAGTEEETVRAVTPDDHQKMDETIAKIHVKEEEEDGEMQHEDEQDLEPEDIEARFPTITDLSLEEEDNMHIEEARAQRDEIDTGVTHEEVQDSDDILLLASENENKSNEGPSQVENQLSVLPGDDRDFKGGRSFTSLHDEPQMDYVKSGIVSEDELSVAQEHVMALRSENDQIEDVKEKGEGSTLRGEREQGAVIEEENVNETANIQTIDKVPEQDDNITSITVDRQEEDISTGHVTCSEEVMQNANTELHTAEFTHREVQSKPRETDDAETESQDGMTDGKSDMTTTDIPVDERFFVKAQVGEKWFSTEVGDRESYIEVACTTASVTVKPEGESGQEISGGFKNISPGICEGQLVVSQELNSPTCEETHEGVPGYNNESGPDENTTQRFLEVGNCKEIQITQLPEEVESKEPESLQNSDCSAGAEYLLVREHKEEEQDSTEDIKSSFDLVAEEHAGEPCLSDAGLPKETETPLVEPALQKSALLFEEEEGKLLIDSMKTEIEQSERKTTKELQDATEELLVEFEKGEGLFDSKKDVAARDDCEMIGAVAVEDFFTDETLKFLEPDVQKMTELSFFQESVDAWSLEQDSYRTCSLLEDFTESGFLKKSGETEAELLEDLTVEMQDAGIDMEETDDGVQEEAADDELQNRNEMGTLNLQAAVMTADLTTERNRQENHLIAESQSLETQNQLSDEALETTNEEMLTETEASDESVTTESKPKDLTVIAAEETAKHVTESEGSFAEETVCSISKCQDVIDEEILDLWIQTALSEDTEGIKQQEEGPDPGQQMDMEKEPSKEEQDEISSVHTERANDQLVESTLQESEPVSDTEMSSSTAESGFLDQSLSEGCTQNSEPLKSTSTESFQGIYDMLASMSELTGTSEPNFESQDILMEETAETGQLYLKGEESVTEIGFHPDSGDASSEARHLNQESDKLHETDKETGSQKEIDAEVTDQARKTDWKNTAEVDVGSLTEKSVLFETEDTKVEDEPLETTVSVSPDEIKHTDSGRSRSGSEASLEGQIVSAESGSKADTCTDTEKKLLKLPSLDKPEEKPEEKPEDNVDLLPGINRPEVAKQPMEVMKVDTSALDFTAQRSRIAVKNPHVRPPKDPRSLLHMPSVEPTPSSRLPVKVPAGVPLGGLGIGIKLPGLGSGFPVLKKTQRVLRDEKSPDTLSQETETKTEEKSFTPKENEAQRKPKWMPPGHPGFGNPLMSELKSKLKKTAKE